MDLREQRKRNNYAMKKRKKHISPDIPEKARKEAAKVCEDLFDDSHDCARKESELVYEYT